MLPNLLTQIGPLPVYTFGVILAAIFVLGVFLFWRAATREGFASDPIFDLIFLATFSALFGGRLSFIISTGEISDPLAILRVGEGIFWAPTFLLGLVVSYLFIRRRKEWSFLKLADFAAPVLALGQGIGFLGAEATSYLLSVLHVGAGYLGLFFVLEFIKRKVTTSGVVFFLYLLFAGFLTVLSESLRATKAFAFGVDLNYFLGGALLVAGILGLLYLVTRTRGILTSLRKKITIFSIIGRVENRLRFRLKVGRGLFSFGGGNEKMRYGYLPIEFLKKIKKRLTVEKRRLEGEEKKLAEQDPFLVPDREVGNPEFAEEAGEGIGHERVAAQRGIVQKLLFETKLALSKFRIGKYGICEECGNRVDRARLEAFPQARHCIDCKKKIEQK